MRNILLRLCIIGLGAFFIGAQAYDEHLISSDMVLSMRAMAIRPKLKSAQTHMRVMRPAYTKDWPDLKPVPRGISTSSGFGIRMHPIYKRRLMHWGVDFPVKEGTQVKAAASGVVIKIIDKAYQSSYGKYVVIRHPNGTQTLYAHNNVNYVSVGQRVSQGQTIAAMGSTGRSTGSHLHFEVRGAKNPF